MTHDRDSSNTPKKVFDFFVGCAQIISTIVGIIGLIVSFIALIWAVRNPNAVPQIINIISGEATATPKIIILPTNTPFPTYTPLSTYTPYPVDTPVLSNTPIPSSTATLFVPPADGILFQDNFENGFKSDWNLDSNWITADGTLSQTYNDSSGSYSWASLNKPEWKNYILSVKINIPFMGSGAQSDVAVAVRVNGQPKYLGVQILPFVGNALFFIGSSNSDSDAVAQSRVFDFDSGSTLEIEANGNNYIVRVNGRQVQQVSLSGYDSGGIALGIDCGSSLGCPSFDNVKVTYLP